MRRGSHADGEQHQHTDDADASSTHRSVHLSGLRGAVTEGIRVIKPDPQAGCGEEGEHEEQEEGMQRWRVSQYEVCAALRQQKCDMTCSLPSHDSICPIQSQGFETPSSEHNPPDGLHCGTHDDSTAASASLGCPSPDAVLADGGLL